MLRAIFPASLLLALAAPAIAQAQDSFDPWSGIVILVSPSQEEDAAPQDAAPENADQTLGLTEESADAPAAEAEPSLGLSPEEEAAPEMPSLWTSLDLGIGDTENIEAPASPRVVVIEARPARTPAQQATLPTRFDLQQGPARFEVITSVATSAPVSSALATSAGGGSGEVKGRLGYSFDNLVVYGVGGLGAAESTGTVSLYDSLVFGSTYKMPLAPYGFRPDDSIGAKLEVADTQAVTTGIELRSTQGGYQRFISLERANAPDASATGLLKAGVVGKF